METLILPTLIVESKKRILKNLAHFWIVVIIFLFNVPVIAQTHTIQLDSAKVSKTALHKFIGIESGYYLGSMIVLSNSWYKDKKNVPFHFFNDNKGYLQVDKFGHAFGSYLESYIGYKWLRTIGLEKNKAIIFGGTLGFVMQSPIEIMDGIHEGWGFSWGDMAANAFGSGLVIGQELIFKEQLIKYKFSYWESCYSQNDNGYLGKTALNRLLKDYNGQTYWFSMPANKLILKRKLPDWLNVAVGYGANGMYGEFENIREYNGQIIPETRRYRQYLFSLDIDWTKIQTNSKFLKTLFTGMTFIKLPFPAFEINSMGKLKGYWMYY